MAEQWFRSIHTTKYGSLIFESVLNLLKQDSYENVFKKLNKKKMRSKMKLKYFNYEKNTLKLILTNNYLEIIK